MKEHDCELNGGKISTNPEDFTKNSSYLYYEIMDTGNGIRDEPCTKGKNVAIAFVFLKPGAFAYFN